MGLVLTAAERVLVEQGKDIVQYGIRGMKWGVRRSEAELAKARKGKSDDDGESKSAPSSSSGIRTNTKVNASTLSDSDLQKVVNRINMEQQYARLTAPPPGPLKKVMGTAVKIGADVATEVAKAQLKAVANDRATPRVAKLLKNQPKKKS